MRREGVTEAAGKLQKLEVIEYHRGHITVIDRPQLEALYTALQTKLDDLALAQSDMQNVLNSIEIAVLFLDQELNVRRCTEMASTILSLRYPDLPEDARRTLDSLITLVDITETRNPESSLRTPTQS